MLSTLGLTSILQVLLALGCWICITFLCGICVLVTEIKGHSYWSMVENLAQNKNTNHQT
jgi:hypothetical protein